MKWAEIHQVIDSEMNVEELHSKKIKKKNNTECIVLYREKKKPSIVIKLYEDTNIWRQKHEIFT